MIDFDADAFVAQLERPRFTAAGRTYVGRLLSSAELDAFAPSLQLMARGGLTDVETRALMREFVDAVFPAPPPRYTRHWLGLVQRPLPQLTPADVFFAMPLAAQLAAITGIVRTLVTPYVSALGDAGGDAPTPSDAAPREQVS